MSDALPTTAFRLEEGVLICSGPGMTEKRIPMGDLAGWSHYLQGDVPLFRLRFKSGVTMGLQDPNGELQRVLSTLGEGFANLDDILQSTGLYHVDERLGRFGYSDGLWSLTANVDLPFQLDVPVGFELERDRPHFPKSMPANVLWIQNNFEEIWNAAARLVNALVESEGITAPKRFALHHLWAKIPDDTLDNAKWRFIVEIKDMSESFELVFRGLEPVSCNVA